MPYGNPMFRSGELRDYLERSKVGLAHLVEHRYQGPREDITERQFADDIAAEAKVTPLQVDFENPVKDVRSMRIPVQEFGRHFEADGLEGTYSFSFTGDPQLFWLKPSTWSSSLPYGAVEHGRVTIGVQGTDPEQIKTDLERQIGLLREHVGWQQAQIERHNQDLWQSVLPQIQQRRRHLERAAQLKNIL